MRCIYWAVNKLGWYLESPTVAEKLLFKLRYNGAYVEVILYEFVIQ